MNNKAFIRIPYIPTFWFHTQIWIIYLVDDPAETETYNIKQT